MDYYQTIEKPAASDFRDRGSKFLGYAYPVSSIMEFKAKLAALKKEHPKAAHHCFAYRIGMEGTNFRVSDDGEPSGSAGKPILGQIDSKELTNVLVVIVRYFGGTLLGIPGLINAYKTTTALALENSPVIRKQVLVKYILEFDYTRMNDIMRLVRQSGAEIVSQDLQLFCKIAIGVPKKNEEVFLKRSADLMGLKIDKP